VRALYALVLRDLRLAVNAGGTGLMSLAFFAAVLTLAPFGLGSDPALLNRVAPGIVWIAALLAAVLSLERLFQADLEDESLDLLALSPGGLSGVVLAKAFAQWLAAGLPLVITAPLFALTLGLDAKGYVPLTAGLAIGTPTLFLIGALGAGLVLGARRGGLLIALIVLPLEVPVLIFGVAAVQTAVGGGHAGPSLMLLGAHTLLSVALVPVAVAAALRIHLS
jgi:heme exporter protein B